MNTIVNPSFTTGKWSIRGSTSHGHVCMMYVPRLHVSDLFSSENRECNFIGLSREKCFNFVKSNLFELVLLFHPVHDVEIVLRKHAHAIYSNISRL